MHALAPQRLDPAGYRRTPWKNGGGVTIDIADAYRPGALPGAWEGMIWRFGRTRIEQPGPFSDLSGFDRHLGVIEGQGLRLHPAGQPVLDVTRPFHPVAFPGEWAIESELTAGPVGVLNLLADRRLADTSLSFHAEPATQSLPAGIVLIYAPAGVATVEIVGQPLTLQPDNCLRFDAAKPAEVGLRAGRIAVASIRPKLGSST